MDNKEILKIISQSINDRFGNIADRVILYGSRTKENCDDSSDYDVLVILNTNVDWQLEWDVYDICFDISLEKNILIDVKILSSADLNTIRGRQPYVQEAISSGIYV